MNKKRISSSKLNRLRKLMSDMFDISFGHNLSDEDRERNYNEYLNLRTEYMTEYKRLSEVVEVVPI